MNKEIKINYNSLYEKVYLIRKVEEKIIELYPTDVIQSPVHLSIGQEAVSAAVCQNLKKEDAVYGTYRGHAMYLAKGGNLNAFFAELFGKETGCCKGRGGSMHIIDPEAGVMGTSAIVGSMIPIAIGHAFAEKLKKSCNITVIFLGDGATDEGVFYESLNFAALHHLRILFVIENNNYAIHSSVANRTKIDIIHKIQNWMDFFTEVIENNVIDVFNYSKKAIDMMTALGGPFLLECKTNRLMEHVGIKEDWDLGYREKPLDMDQLLILKDIVKNTKQIEEKIDKQIEEAVQFAKDSSFPKKESLYDNA